MLILNVLQVIVLCVLLALYIKDRRMEEPEEAYVITITKGDKSFEVVKTEDCWIASREIDGVFIDYEIPFENAADDVALARYIAETDLF